MLVQTSATSTPYQCHIHVPVDGIFFITLHISMISAILSIAYRIPGMLQKRDLPQKSYSRLCDARLLLTAPICPIFQPYEEDSACVNQRVPTVGFLLLLGTPSPRTPIRGLVPPGGMSKDLRMLPEAPDRGPGRRSRGAVAGSERSLGRARARVSDDRHALGRLPSGRIAVASRGRCGGAAGADIPAAGRCRAMVGTRRGHALRAAAGRGVARASPRRVAGDGMGGRRTARRAHGAGCARRQRVGALGHGLLRGPAQPPGLVGLRRPPPPRRGPAAAPHSG